MIDLAIKLSLAVCVSFIFYLCKHFPVVAPWFLGMFWVSFVVSLLPETNKGSK